MRLKLLVVLTLIMACGNILHAAETKQEIKPDERLDQKITYQAKNEFLYKVLDDLTNKTKIDMDCGRTSKDWQVREVKVSIFVKEMPVKDFQKNLAELLHFRWSQGIRDGVPYYKLTQDLKAKKEEEDLRIAAEEAEKKEQLEARKSAMSELDKLDSLSPEEIEKLKTDSPWLYILAKEPFGKACMQLMRSVPGARQAMLDGNNVETTFANLPPQANEAARNLINEVIKLTEKIDPDRSENPRFARLADNLSKATFLINSPSDSTTWKTSGVFGELSIALEGEPRLGLPFFDPKSREANTTALMLLKMLSGETVGVARKEVEKTQQAKIESKGNELEPLPENPELDKTVKLELKMPINDADMIEELAKKSDFQFISDSFRTGDHYTSITEGKVRVLVDDIRTMFSKEAEVKDKLIVFRDKEWFKKRTWAVSEEWMQYWRQKARNYTLTTDDMADIASLTDDQLSHTLICDEALHEVYWNAFQNRDVLRFYASLSKDQKSSLTSTEGLGVYDVSDEQWPAFEKLIPVAQRSSKDETILNRIKIKLSGHYFSLILSADPSDPESKDTELKDWTIMIPVKPEPVSEKQ